ncbi:LLM class flavin-dependent oxidoreductase [Gulosibacter sp. 10]|uniref:LLM class flavin-dependent oxidoreductase n=1 Tax=Gulosibacter sp. 10 TaxID=1255570 RepID=UPI00097F0114|nr:LLM class flavin-dependent oxidoreductase [Gulosibacter sp. 10]SJM67326.1 Luciferase-like monooxygenase [Gulosibacter sp. 10]
MTKISVLDLIPVASDQRVPEALASAREFIAAADRLGYHRYWVAEHHNTEAIASTSPAVVLANLGTATERIRLGSGGVMLPNHSPLIVAEQFALLEGMFPGRVDVGLGRAPGTDPITARALRRDMSREAVDRYPSDVIELAGYLGDVREQVDAGIFEKLKAAADLEHRPEIWLLGSSLYSAELAGLLGLPFSYANHFAMGQNAVGALQHYREHFTPSPVLDKPRAMVSATVLVADSLEEARALDLPTRVNRYELMAGKLGRLKSPEEAREFAERVEATEIWHRSSGSQHVGPIQLVANGIRALRDQTGADEIMLQANGHDVATRIRSITEIAEALELS